IAHGDAEEEQPGDYRPDPPRRNNGQDVDKEPDGDAEIAYGLELKDREESASERKQRPDSEGSGPKVVREHISGQTGRSGEKADTNEYSGSREEARERERRRQESIRFDVSPSLSEIQIPPPPKTDGEWVP